MSQLPPIYKVTDDTPPSELLQEASQVLRRGGVLVCATDTGYLLGVDGLNTNAIHTLYQIKGRSFQKPIHLVVADVEMAKRLAYVNLPAERTFRYLLPGPLTLILKKKPIVPNILVAGLETVGLRLPNTPLLLRLVQAAGTPITATSANVSGANSSFSVGEVLAELGDAVKQVDLILDQGKTEYTTPSTILDLTQFPPKILREGPVSANTLREHKIL